MLVSRVSSCVLVCLGDLGGLVWSYYFLFVVREFGLRVFFLKN